ncbi:MAG TPA: peptidylprolyl isomerase [Gemmataceae bacterium]|nr:peptidylprolyl isomerase [Gemmataceae bacterium]
MGVRARSYRGAALRLAAIGVLVAAGLTGCRKPVPKAPPKSTENEAAKPAPKAAVEARYRLPFADATRKDPLADWTPPSTTAAGKSVGPLYEQVQKSWDGIHFVNDSGKRIVYHAILDTELGPIDLELRPDWAPNHVRSFIALAQAGYYDGLVFNRVVNQTAKKLGEKVELIEGGGPLGATAMDQDGIGYWLKDEFNPKLAHEEGVVGASHGEEADSAACKFYVMLSKAPRLDGNYTLFAKVAHGLDVAKKIEQQPVAKDDDSTAEQQEDDVSGGDYRLAKPVVIRKVTIQAKEVDKDGPGGDN